MLSLFDREKLVAKESRLTWNYIYDLKSTNEIKRTTKWINSLIYRYTVSAYCVIFVSEQSSYDKDNKLL